MFVYLKKGHQDIFIKPIKVMTTLSVLSKHNLNDGASSNRAIKLAKHQENKAEGCRNERGGTERERER